MGSIVRIAIILSAALIGGCASIVDEPDQNIAIMSTPGEANFVIKNGRGLEVLRGTTPSVVNLEKSNGYFEGIDYTIEVSKAGYESRLLTIKPEPSMWYMIGNVATFFVGWFIVDPMTGAMWDLKPNMLNVELQSAQAMAPPPAPAPEIVPENTPPATGQFGALVASFESQEQAELGKTEIWSRHPQLLGAIQPSITYGSVADGELRYLVIGGGLTNDEALGVCANLEQRNEPCTVIQFQS